MNISFLTIDVSEARRRLEHPGYKWLPKSCHELVLKRVAEKKCRVQCTMMYPNPQLEFQDAAVYFEIKAAMDAAKEEECSPNQS